MRRYNIQVAAVFACVVLGVMLICGIGFMVRSEVTSLYHRWVDKQVRSTMAQPLGQSNREFSRDIFLRMYVDTLRGLPAGMYLSGDRRYQGKVGRGLYGMVGTPCDPDEPEKGTCYEATYSLYAPGDDAGWKYKDAVLTQWQQLGWWFAQGDPRIYYANPSYDYRFTILIDRSGDDRLVMVVNSPAFRDEPWDYSAPHPGPGYKVNLPEPITVASR